LRNELFSNASFLCERLFAEVKNEEVKLLLSECYLGMLIFSYMLIIKLSSNISNPTIKLGEGKAYKAYEVLKDCQ
jgi:hypothetical protein